MSFPLFDHQPILRALAAALLPDGRVLVAGGLGANGKPLDSIELLTLERRR